jgi:glutamate-1-semialdehyde 2,1-aminomutase
MISVHFSAAAVIDFDSAAKGNNETFKKFFHGMLKRGIYIAPSAFESWFITDALSYQDLNETIAAVEDIAKDL